MNKFETTGIGDEGILEEVRKRHFGTANTQPETMRQALAQPECCTHDCHEGRDCPNRNK